MMRAPGFSDAPSRDRYDVVIVGGAIMGCSAAWWLTEMDDFDGSVLVLERDASYAQASTTHTNSCIRQQYSSELNIRLSQFTAEFLRTIRDRFGGDERVPNLKIHDFGYMYLASDQRFADVLRASHAVQSAAGAGTRLMTPDEIAEAYPFYDLDGIILGSCNTVDEGYWDGSTVFECWRRSARERGVEFVADEVVGMSLNRSGDWVESVTLASGRQVSCGQVLNASGPRAARTAAMAGLELPVEPRKRFTWVIRAETPLDRDLPLTIDPSGVHVRELGGGTYQAGGHPDPDPAADYDDFDMDHALWESFVWPALAARIPAFETVKVEQSWAGHYAMNVFDHNAVIGPHDRVANFLFLNGFSGHGLQQSPAMGRGAAELLTYGEFRTMDLSVFGYDRIARNAPVLETAVI